MSAPSDTSNAPIFTAAAPVTPTKEFEFGEAENKVFSALATSMRFVGTAQAVAAGVLVLVSVVHVWAGGPPALVSSVPMSLAGAMLAVTGVWLRAASEPVARIVSTQGSDVRNLMEAMAGLARMYALQRLFYIAVGALAALWAVAMVVVLVFFVEFIRTMM